MEKLAIIFATVFLAELGDKTQLATVLFATDGEHSPWMIFAASAAALVLSTALAVLAGHYLGKYLEAIPLQLIAGLGFIAIGSFSVWEYFRA